MSKTSFQQSSLANRERKMSYFSNNNDTNENIHMGLNPPKRNLTKSSYNKQKDTNEGKIPYLKI